MTTPILRQIRSNTRPPLRRGFSFTEILFAVMILGIGFIMVAAMFPVAIHQTEASNSETIGAATGRQGFSVMTQIAAMNWPPASAAGVIPMSMLLPTFATMTTLPPPSNYILPAAQNSMVVPGEVWSMYDSRDAWTYTYTPSGGSPVTYNHQILLWDSVARNLIQPGDPRFGWAVMYKRDLIVQGQPGTAAGNIMIAPYAQVFVVALQSRAKQAYSSATDIQTPPTTATPFWCQYVPGVTVTAPTFAGGPSTITFPPTTPSLIAENTYVVVSEGYKHSEFNGRIYRIGNPRPDLGPTVWEFLPGQGLSLGDPGLVLDVFVVGRGIDATNGKNYGGLAQDISVYTTYVQIPN